MKEPGVNLPATAVAPVWEANFKTALWPKVLDEIATTSDGFGIAAIILAAKTIFSQVLLTLMMLTPSTLVL